jgi:hypothetical protein
MTLIAHLPPGLCVPGRASSAIPFATGTLPLLLMIELYIVLMRDNGIALQVMIADSMPCLSG